MADSSSLIAARKTFNPDANVPDIRRPAKFSGESDRGKKRTLAFKLGLSLPGAETALSNLRRPK